MASKIFTLVILIVCFSKIHCQSHNLNLGTIGVSDRLLALINHAKEAIFFTVRTSDIDFPYTGIPQPQNITAIQVRDYFTDGTGGYASVTSGGIGQNYVRLHLKTQRGGPMNFTITFYGR